MSTKNHERHEERTAPKDEKDQDALSGEKEDSKGGTAGAPSVDSEDEEIKTLRERVSALEAREAALNEECSSLKDQYLRKLADYENFRKRMFREREDSLKFANTGLLSDLIAILDDFTRAIGSSEHTNDYKVLHDGVILIQRQLGQMLSNKYGLVTFNSVGEIFDPNIHEAVASEMADVDEPIISQEFLPGYKLHDRVIRSAKVKVQMPLPPAQQDSSNPEEAAASDAESNSNDGGAEGSTSDSGK
jgi:molecular chaperone GrpE